MGNFPSKSGEDNSKPGTWYWKSNKDPWSSEKEEWTPYSVYENFLLEDALLKGNQIVELVNHKVDMKKKIQYSKGDFSKQRPVKRVLESCEPKPTGSNNERSVLPLPIPKSVVTTNDVTFRKYPSLVYKWLPDADNHIDDYEWIFRQVIAGIREEGVLQGQEKEAERMIEQLRQDSKKDFGVLDFIDRISYDEMKKALNNTGFVRSCINLYTQETFLYKALNKALREEDMSKSQTLGPFAYVLNHALRSNKEIREKYSYQGPVHRKANIERDVLKKYQEILESPYPAFCWSGFVSTSQEFSGTKNFVGDAIFIISTPYSNCCGIDISSFSNNPDEKEVLFPAESVFKITKIERNSLIYLERIDVKHISFPSFNLKQMDVNYKSLINQRNQIFGEISRFDSADSQTTQYDTVLIPCGKNILQWRALIPGPKDTCYDGAIFHADIKIQPGYPHKAPEVRFLTQVWHPNISSLDGSICFDFFEKAGLIVLIHLKVVVVSLQLLLADLKSDDPLDLIAHHQARESPEEFKTRVNSFCSESKSIWAKVQKLVNSEKNISSNKAKLALLMTNFDQKTAESLCERTSEDIAKSFDGIYEMFNPFQIEDRATSISTEKTIET